MKWTAGYHELPVPSRLRDAVTALWVRRMPDEPTPSVDVWPDAGIDVIWRRGREALVAGADTGPAPAALEPRALLIGIRFRPGAAGAALRLPMSDLRDRRVPLSGIRADLARRLPGDLSPSAALTRMLEVTTDLTEASPADPVVLGAAERLLGPHSSVDLVTDEAGLSGRQLRRRFLDALGYGPKTLQRVARFQRLLALLETGRDVSLARVALELGFADQAHMTRECRRLSGRSPGKLLAQAKARSSATEAA